MPSTSGCITSSRQVGERATSPPVRRVLRPPKSSPVGVAARKGASSLSTRAITSGATTRSTIAQPSRRSAATTAEGSALAGRRSTATRRVCPGTQGLRHALGMAGADADSLALEGEVLDRAERRRSQQRKRFLVALQRAAEEVHREVVHDVVGVPPGQVARLARLVEAAQEREQRAGHLAEVREGEVTGVPDLRQADHAGARGQRVEGGLLVRREGGGLVERAPDDQRRDLDAGEEGGLEELGRGGEGKDRPHPWAGGGQ